MTTLHFTKMQGNGNDFIVVNAIRQAIAPTPALCRALGNRYFGIGADQLLWVEAPAATDEVDLVYRIFNADGQEVETCGNGARAFLRFVRAKNLCHKPTVRVRTKAGILELRELDQADAPPAMANWIEVNMGVPRLSPPDIPFDPTLASPVGAGWKLAKLLEKSLTEPLTDALTPPDLPPFFVVSMGNPHAVITVPDTTTAPVTRWGAPLQAHATFPASVNVGVMQIDSAHEIHLRVYERGVGETLSCGSGACAAVVAGILQGQLKSPVQVHTRGGPLRIRWAGVGAPVLMAGDAQIVFEGQIELEDLLPGRMG